MSYYLRHENDFLLADALCVEFTPSSIGPAYERNGRWDFPPTLYRGCSFDRASLPTFSHDRNACAEAEAEIARRGLLEDYVGAVMDILEVSCYGSAEQTAWADTREIAQVLTAPPAIRVQAMLAVLR